MKKTIITLIFSFIVIILSGQGLKQRIADRYYTQLSFVKASEIYEELANSDKVNSHVIRRLAESYNKINNVEKSVFWYAKLYDRNEANLKDKYEYVLVLRESGNYDKANEVLEDYIKSGGKDEFAIYAFNNPDFLIKYKTDLKKFQIFNEVVINSKENDFSPTFYKNGILFSSPSRESKNKKVFAWDLTKFTSIYYAEEKDGDLSTVRKIDVGKNEKYHDGPAIIDPLDSTLLYVTRSHYVKEKVKSSNEGTVEVNLYIMRLPANGNGFSFEIHEPFPATDKSFSTGNATISNDGSVMIFSSDRPGTRGESDLWITRRKGKGWSIAENLGDSINTNRRDNFPFLAKNGDLYFSSDGGWPGYGGYDIFRVRKFLNGGRKIENIGSPINSEKDDFGFIVDTEKNKGYFTSNREGGEGEDDIYSFVQNISLIKICVIDKETREPISESQMSVNTPLGDELISAITPEGGCTDYYEIISNLDYSVSASKEGYLSAEKVSVNLENGEKKTITIELEKAKKKECPDIELEDIFYDFDKYYIRNDASIVLDELLEFLVDYPNVKIELSSHTDSRGSHQYNDWLSQKRAESCVNYLIEKGIDKDRLKAQGFGERQLVNRCSDGVPCSKDEHQANRRTEITIITDDCFVVKKKPNRYMEEK